MTVDICAKSTRFRLKIHEISKDPTVQVRVLDLESNTQDPTELREGVAAVIDFGNFIITITSIVASKLELRERSNVPDVLDIILEFPLIRIGNSDFTIGILCF
jgi:hypothetical protein